MQAIYEKLSQYLSVLLLQIRKLPSLLASCVRPLLLRIRKLPPLLGSLVRPLLLQIRKLPPLLGSLVRPLLLQIRKLPPLLTSRVRRRKPQVEDDRFIIWKPPKESRGLVEMVAFAMIVIGLMIAVGGGIITRGRSQSLVGDFYANIATELASIAVTVLIIDRLNERRLQRHEKEQIIRQMASRSNNFALDAVRLARDHGWLTDGSLTGVLLMYANLRGAPLDNVRLRSAHMFGVNLENADLSQACMERAFLEGANLRNARLTDANLKDTVLLGACLENADLWLANLEKSALNGATLEGAYLLQANLRAASLENVNVKGAQYDQFTLWPEDFDPVASGAIYVENDEFGIQKGRGGAYVHIGLGGNVVNKRPWT